MVRGLDALAGTMPDGQVAERLGIDVSVVKTWRREHGVAAFVRGPPRADAKSGTTQVPTVPRSTRRVVRRRGDIVEDVVIENEPMRPPTPAPAPTLGATRSRSADSRLGAFRDRLGRVSDDAIAAEAGVSRGVVGAYRRKLGVTAYKGYLFKPREAPPRAARPPAAPRSSAPRAGGSRLESFSSLIGVMSDGDVAAKAGVSRTAVVAWRKRNGIPPARRIYEWTRGEPTPPSRPAAQSPTGRHAYRIVVQAEGAPREFIAFGDAVVDVCAAAEARLAARGGNWRVIEVRYLGDALS